MELVMGYALILTKNKPINTKYFNFFPNKIPILKTPSYI